ncbi:MAG: tRNA 2-thiouridine(34) synthase MnmA [Actinomycetales bacterium]|nr:tRNA 2-thiouridine(34) synthase MnmA [Actinomycetales bacterium]
MRVIAAMSGGVDSSVAAARMVDAGHEVVGVHLALASTEASGVVAARGCCTLDDARDARRVADLLGIPFYVWDLSERFRSEVIEDFIDEYRHGRTPNPCLRCNERIKFAAVLDRAIALGFDAIASGHYARRVDGPQGPELHRAVDPAKDQSYVLGVLSAHQIAHSLFPLGDSLKEQVRREAEDRGLLVARKPDSHDICFIPDGDTAAYVRSQVGTRSGDIVDVSTDAVVGHHQGAEAFTIGQRRGLDLRVPTADGSPRYVIDVDIVTNTVRVGPPELLDVTTVVGTGATWAGPEIGAVPTPVTAQVRAHGTPVPARARMAAGLLVVDLDEPIRGLAPGQAVVLYDGTRVVGSATVDRTGRAMRP